MSIFPVTTDQEKTERIFVTSNPATTTNLNLYRFGSYTHYDSGIKRPIAVPHPQNEHYSSIHTAQRKQKDNEWWQRKKQQLHREDINHQRWVRPMTESAFQIHRPNINNWNRVLHVGFPKW